MAKFKRSTTRPGLIIATGNLVIKDGRIYINGESYGEMVADWFARRHIGRVRTLIETLKEPSENLRRCNCEIMQPLGTWHCPEHGHMQSGL